jgi:hypothetical protein
MMSERQDADSHTPMLLDLDLRGPPSGKDRHYSDGSGSVNGGALRDAEESGGQ